MDKKKHSASQTILLILIILALAAAAFCMSKVVRTLLGYADAKNSYSSIADQYVTVQTSAAASASPSPSASDSSQEPSATAEPVETEQSPISIDFYNLRYNVNPEIVGWIYCPDTVINYPITQHGDNRYYLDVNSDGHGSASGSIFLDCANSSAFRDANNILYGHHMMDNSMFGSLYNWNKQEYYEQHPVMYLNTAESGNYRIDIFASFEAPAGGEAFDIYFPSDGKYNQYVLWLKETSNIDVPITPTDNQPLLSLTTCAYSYDQARQIVVGVMTPIQ